MDDAVRAEEMTLLVEADEVDAHPPLHVRIHREVHARPVEAASEHPELPVDARLVVAHPLPHLGEELLAPQTLLVHLFRELFLDDDLRDDPGVVRAGQVERGFALHAMPARHEVLVATEPQGVAHVQVTGHVRQRQHHHEALLVA